MRAWLTSAVVASVLAWLPGCYADHGRAEHIDAGPVDAAPLCMPSPGLVSGLFCPEAVAAGAATTISVEHQSGLCCPASAASAHLERTGERTYRVVAEWDLCQCCEACDCLGPTVHTAVTTPPLEPGLHTFVAGDHRCEIRVGDAECRDAPVIDAHTPTATLSGRPLAALLRAEGASCGCSPMGAIHRGREGELVAALRVCGCSDLDPCVDPGYEVTAELALMLAAGSYRIDSEVGPLEAQVFDEASCSSIVEPDDVRLIAPAASFVHDQPPGVWAEVDYQAAYCCARPATLAMEVRGPPVLRAFELRDCVQEDCACEPGPPRPLTDLVYLGRMAPGTQRVRIGAIERVVEIPSR